MQFFVREIAANGLWPTYQRKFEQPILHCIPQVLKPLQFAGRLLKPCLIHGDLWEGNTGIHNASKDFIFFAAAVMYVHNEFELWMWRREIVRLENAYTEH